MADKEKNTYEKVHKQLSDAMQDAYINDVLKDIKEPNIDLSFLVDDNKKKRKHSKLLSIGTVAAAAIIVLFTANIVLLSSNSIDSYGDKGILHRLYFSLSELFTDENDEYINDISSSIEITNEDEYDDAKEYLPQLYLPRYIPSDYSLNKLYIEKYNSGDAISIYSYSNDDSEMLEISCTYCNRENFYYEYNGEGEVIELVDRKLYVEWDDVQKEYYLTVYTEICSINIYMENCYDKNELIMIGENMTK